MKLAIIANLEYDVQTPSTLILNLHALRTPHQTVLEEVFTIDPYLKVEELISSHGENRFVRIDIPERTDIKITYNATVDNSFKLVDLSAQQLVPVSELSTLIFPYLF